MQESTTSSTTQRRKSATYSLKETADLAGCSYGWLYRLVQADKSPFTVIRLGRMYRFRRSEIDAALGIEAEERESA